MVYVRYKLFYVEFPSQGEMIRCRVKAHSEESIYQKLAKEFNLPRYEVQIQNIGHYVEEIETHDSD